MIAVKVCMRVTGAPPKRVPVVFALAPDGAGAPRRRRRTAAASRALS